MTVDPSPDASDITKAQIDQLVWQIDQLLLEIEQAQERLLSLAAKLSPALFAHRPIHELAEQVVGIVRQDQADTVQRQRIAVEGDIPEGADVLG